MVIGPWPLGLSPNSAVTRPFFTISLLAAAERPRRTMERHGGPPVICLTRLNGQNFVVNAEKIRYVECTPDTLVCCDNGEKMMVKESLQEVVKRAIDYARTVRRPIAD